MVLRTVLLAGLLSLPVAADTPEYIPDFVAAEAASKAPQKRLIQPAEIAALVVFLCGESAVGLSMEDITVAGGAIW